MAHVHFTVEDELYLRFKVECTKRGFTVAQVLRNLMKGQTNHLEAQSAREERWAEEAKSDQADAAEEE